MGFFNKLKADLNHGGIKLSLQAPGSVPENQPIPITVTVTADSPQTVNSITIKLEAQEHEQGFGGGGGGGMNGGGGYGTETTNYQTVAQVENRDQFAINPGETKTVALQLYLNNGGSNMQGQPGQLGGGVSGILQSIAMRGLTHVSFMYRLHASADVAGVGIGPSQNIPIQIAPATDQQAAVQAESVVPQGQAYTRVRHVTDTGSAGASDHTGPV